MWHFLDKYYVINTLFILSYIPIRTMLPHPLLPKKDPYFGIPKETEIVITMILFIISKYRKCATREALIATIFLYCKVGLAGLYYFLGWTYFGWYLIICVMLFLTLKPPKYSGPQDWIHLNAESFTRRVQKDSGKTKWIVYFYTDWCERCTQHDSMFAALSVKHASDTVKFAKLDIDRYPELAEQFAIEISSMSWQLPTLILFTKGKEQQRLPSFKEDGSVIKTILELQGVEAYFSL